MRVASNTNLMLIGTRTLCSNNEDLSVPLLHVLLFHDATWLTKHRCDAEWGSMLAQFAADSILNCFFVAHDDSGEETSSDRIP